MIYLDVSARAFLGVVISRSISHTFTFYPHKMLINCDLSHRRRRRRRRRR
jgi:hypothetical protein